MRNRYGRALYGLMATVAVTATLGLTAAGAADAAAKPAKPAITPACTFNSYCSDPLFNVEFGIQYFTNSQNFSFTPGGPVNLAYANDNNPGQDWRVNFQYPVFVLYHLGFISAAMELHYHFRPAFEVMWTPYGVTSNLCRGVARPAYENEKVTLQPCGNFPKTLWIVKNNFTRPSQLHGDVQYGGNSLINGSTNNPSVPYVLTAGGSLFGGNPFAQLRVDQLVADDGLPNEGQLWCTAHETFPGSSTPTVSPSVGPPTVGPPTFTANNPCFGGSIRIGNLAP
jgi:hypothetical protein